MSLLPHALRRARWVARWSSSICMHGKGPPATLGMHAWLWLDDPLSPEEAKTLTTGIDGHMRDALGHPRMRRRARDPVSVAFSARPNPAELRSSLYTLAS